MSFLCRYEILMGYYIMCVYFLALLKSVLYHIIANNCLIHQEITNISTTNLLLQIFVMLM